jgi:hypothetical protein
MEKIARAQEPCANAVVRPDCISTSLPGYAKSLCGPTDDFPRLLGSKQLASQKKKDDVFAYASYLNDTHDIPANYVDRHCTSMDPILRGRKKETSANAIARNSCGGIPTNSAKCCSKGSISAEVVGRSMSHKSIMDKHTQFTILVRKGWSTTTIKRRYSEFAELDKQLRPKMNLPSELPPKDPLTKIYTSVMNDPSFMNQREHSLGRLLEAMIAADPTLRSPELRKFLQIAGCSVDGR